MKLPRQIEMKTAMGVQAPVACYQAGITEGFPKTRTLGELENLGTGSAERWKDGQAEICDGRGGSGCINSPGREDFGSGTNHGTEA